MSRCTVWKHRERDAEFAEAEERALTVFRMQIEDEFRRRAMEGVERPVFQRGKEVGSFREYSDCMLIEYARRQIPEYRPKFNVEQTTTHEGGVSVGFADLERLPREGRDLLRRLLEIEIPDEDRGTTSEETAS